MSVSVSLPSLSQSIGSVLCQYSVSYCLSVGPVWYSLCGHQEQIISAKPAPYFGVVNFQLVLPDVSVGSPPTIHGGSGITTGPADPASGGGGGWEQYPFYMWDIFCKMSTRKNLHFPLKRFS